MLGGELFEVQTIKGKQVVTLPWERLSKIKDRFPEAAAAKPYGKLRGVIGIDGGYTLLAEEKLSLILSLVPSLDIDGARERRPSKTVFNARDNLEALLAELPALLCPARWKREKKELGFICLSTDSNGNYRFGCSRGFHTALNESLASVETLIDELDDETGVELKHIVNQTYRRLSDLLR